MPEPRPSAAALRVEVPERIRFTVLGRAVCRACGQVMGTAMACSVFDAGPAEYASATETAEALWAAHSPECPGVVCG